MTEADDLFHISARKENLAEAGVLCAAVKMNAALFVDSVYRLRKDIIKSDIETFH